MSNLFGQSKSSKASIFFKGLTSGAVTQVVSFAVGVASVSLGLGYLGSIQYGVWMVISSIIAYFGMSQFGVGTASAALISGNDRRENQGLIFRRAFRLLLLFALSSILLTMLVAVLPRLWSPMFGNISSELRRDAVTATIVLVLLTLLRLPVIAILSAFFGLQEVWWERLYGNFLPTIFGFLVLLIVMYLKGGLVMLAYCTGGAHMLVGLLAALHFYRRHGDMMINSATEKLAGDPSSGLFSSGGRFFFIGIASMVVWQTDAFIISYYLGPESVTAYSVTFKLFAATLSVFTIANMVLMPMFGNAAAKGEWLWAKEIYNFILPINTILGGLIWIGGVVFAESIILFWTGKAGYGGALVVFSLGGYAYVLSSVNLNSNILSGMNLNRSLLWIGVAEAVLNFALSMILVRFFGAGGVALGTFISALLTVYCFLPIDLARQTRSRLKVRWAPVIRHFLCAVFPGLVCAYVVFLVYHGVELWIYGGCLCVLYFSVSLWMLPKHARDKLLNMRPRRLS